MKNRTLLLALSLFVLGLAIPKPAQAQAQAEAQAEEPAPGVARVSLIRGDVSTLRGDTGDWVATTINTPLVPGDKVATGADSRTEVQLDYADIMRLAHSSEAKIADLTRDRIQVQLASGLMDIVVIKGGQANVEIDTPNMAVEPVGEGVYRIQVVSPSETQLIVREGTAQVATPQGSTTVKKDDVIYVQGSENPEYRIARAPARDAWDQWNSDRDGAMESAHSWKYANRYYTGANDLDRYGHWVQVPDYDWCWVPYVNAGWVPYRDGRWLWEPYWGWTWVSYEPWGWAPYHYGRWFWWGNSWTWWPGYTYYGYYPTWAPAYVTFLGFGFGGRNWSFGFGFGFNSIGWCPLGPYGAVNRWWGRRNGYNVVNITNIVNVRNGYNMNVRRMVGNRGRMYTTNLHAALTNYNVRRAITVVPTHDFAGGRIPRNVRTVNPTVLRNADVVRGTLPVVPTRASLAPTNRAVSRANLPKGAVNNERFFTRRAVPTTPARNFNTEAANIRRMVQTHNPTANNGRTLSAERGVANGARSGQATPAGTQRSGGVAGAARQAGSRANARATEQATVRPNSGPRITVQGGERAPQAQARSQAGPATDRAWQRFGSANGNRGVSPANGNLLSQNRAQRPAPQQRQAQPAARAQQGDQNGFRRFSAQPGPGSNGGRATPSVNRSRQTAPAQTPRARSTAPSRVGNQGSWQQFNRQNQPASGRGNGGTAAPRSERTSPGFQRFTPQSQNAPAGGRGQFNAPAPRSEQGGGGWNRFPARSSQPRSGNAPRQGYERPQLRLSRPIVRERSRTYGGGNGGSYGRSGGGRVYSAPRGGGRSYSAPQGGGRTFSAPRGGGGGRTSSAPRGSSGGRGGRGRH